jgi:glucokinase
MTAAIGIDVGGTKIGGGVVDAGGRVLDREQVPTPADGPGTLAAIRSVVATLLGRNPDVAALGVGAAGLVEWPAGRIRWAPHNAYRDLPLRDVLAAWTGLPVVVDNDANVAAWAEARHGAGHGADDLVLLTVGTGIGTGLVLDGRVYRGASGLAAELGHTIVDVDGPACPCGNVGCLEAVASGSALGRYGREAAAADPGGAIARLAGGPGAVTGLHVSRAAAAGDRVALGLFERLGFWLGVGVANAVTTFDPAVVVIGGGLSATGELLLGPARAGMERLTLGRAHRELPAVVTAALGPAAGLVGAATVALEACK